MNLPPSLHRIIGQSVRLFVAALTFGVLQAAATAWPPIKLWPFACGSAHLAAGVLGCPIEAGEGEWRLLTQPLGSIVHEGCSGYNYFTLLCMFGAFLVWGGSNRSGAAKVALLVAGLPLAVGVAILVNTGRILSAFHVRVHAAEFLPDNYLPAAHLLTGLSVTTCTLAIIVWGRNRYLLPNDRT